MWSLKYSSESAFDGQSERTKSHAGLALSNSALSSRETHPPEIQLARSRFDGSRWVKRRERVTVAWGEGKREEKAPIVSFNDNRRGRRTFDRINRLVSLWSF